MAGPRRRSREIALQILHQIDAGAESDAGVALDRYFAHLAFDGGPAGDDDEESIPGGARIDRPLVEELVRGVSAHQVEIDDLLTALSRSWRLERMAVVERNVIRIALYELRYCPTVPINVVLNEAVELSKRYGTAEGSAFVNGLLERAVTEGIRPGA
jgi:N utilization substance protein B